MCCVCDFVCKLVSCIASTIFIIGVILLILWLTKVIGGGGSTNDVNVAQNQISEMGRQISPKFFGVTDKAE